MQMNGYEAAKMMEKEGVRHLVVLDGARVAGVLSDRDLRAAQPSMLLVKEGSMRNKALGVLHVAEMMSEAPFIVDEDAPAEVALRAMEQRKIGCVPVVDHQGALVGIVTGMDVVRLALGLLGKTPQRPVFPALTPAPTTRITKR